LLLYYITDRSQFPGNEPARRQQLLDTMVEAALAGVDFIQLREKDLNSHDLETLARQAVDMLKNESVATKFLINSRTDVAIAVGADGVHLRSDDISPTEVRALWAKSGASPRPIIAVSCHSEDDIAAAEAHGADFAVFAAVFEKRDQPSSPPAGLASLRQACRHKVPVLALGGVTLENARQCLDCGAAGLAGIRLFQQGDAATTIRRLRET